MKVRPQVAALIVLLVVMGFVFVLVGEAGVSTDAIKPTATVSPTAGADSAATSGTAANWVESTPGSLTYAPDAERDATVQYLSGDFATVAGQIGAQTPAGDSTYPLLDMAQDLAAMVVSQLDQLQLSYDETAPAILKIGDVPAAVTRFVVPPQPMSTGQDYPGFDLAYVLVSGGEDRMVAFLYQVPGELDESIYQDFQVWVAENGAEIAAPPEAEATAEPTEAVEPALESTEEAVSPTPEVAPVLEATEVVATEATPAPEVTEEAAATAEPEAAGTAEAVADWTEVAEGVLMYSADPTVTAQVSYTLVSVDQMVDPEQLATLPEDPVERAMAILQIVREGHETQVATAGIVMEEDAYQGPDIVEIDGATGATLRVTIAPQSLNDQDYPGVDQELTIFPREDGWVLTVSYVQQGEADAAVHDSYRVWLNDHMEDLIALEAPAPDLTAEATESPADASAPTADVTEAAN